MGAETSVGVWVKFAFCVAVVTEIRILVKVPHNKFNERPFSRSRVFTDRHIFWSAYTFRYKFAENILTIYSVTFMSVNCGIIEVNQAPISLWHFRLLQLYLVCDAVQMYECFGGIFCIYIETAPVQNTYRVGGQEKEIMEHKK
jgi:hypothetical protein